MLPSTAMSASQSSATWIGYSALFLWACSGVLASSVIKIPTFEVLSVAFSISFGLTALLLTMRRRWTNVKQPLLLWVIGMIGVYGNDALYIAAFKHAPAAQADLISYLYPILIILLASYLPSEKFSFKYIIAGFLGFFGSYLLITAGGDATNFQLKYMTGYFLAFIDAIVWSVYCIAARYYKNTPSEMIGMYCGCGLILSLIMHISYEQTIIPNLHQTIVLIIMGLTTQGSAYFMWDYGIKRGNFNLLSVLAYSNPIIAVILLIIAGKSHYSDTLLIATLLISLGGALAGIDVKKILGLIRGPTMPRERHD